MKTLISAIPSKMYNGLDERVDRIARTDGLPDAPSVNFVGHLLPVSANLITFANQLYQPSMIP